MISSRWDVFTISVYDYASDNSDFTYTCIPAKGRKMNMMMNAKEGWEKERNVEIIICRKFKKNYLKFWNWYRYLTNPYYKFPQCK